MILLKGKEKKRIAPLFKKWNDPFLWSCIQEYAGEAWIDKQKNPSSGQITIGAFCFFSGVPNQRMIQNIPQKGVYQKIVLVPENEAWASEIEQYYKGKYEKAQRYAIKNETGKFNPSKLREYASALSETITLKRIDRSLYEKIKEMSWMKYLCSEYPTYEAFEKDGFGFVAIEKGEPVSGASSYVRYKDGIEVEVDTLEEYRRKGLALACASRLILECLDRGLYPHWDAANK